jgi:excisionase family DNA binding protein
MEISIEVFEPKYNVLQAAKALGVSKQTVYRLIDARMLGAIRVGGSYRIPESEIKRYMNANFHFGVPIADTGQAAANGDLGIAR